MNAQQKRALMDNKATESIMFFLFSPLSTCSSFSEERNKKDHFPIPGMLRAPQLSLNIKNSPYFCILSFNMIISSSMACLSGYERNCLSSSHYQLSIITWTKRASYLSMSESCSFLCLNSALSRWFLQCNLRSSMRSIWR